MRLFDNVNKKKIKPYVKNAYVVNDEEFAFVKKFSNE